MFLYVLESQDGVDAVYMCPRNACVEASRVTGVGHSDDELDIRLDELRVAGRSRFIIDNYCGCVVQKHKVADA